MSGRDKWIEALRSGKYEQTNGNLRNEHGYCCLGVACDVYQQEVGDLVVQKVKNMWSYNSRCGSLPGKVRAWLGLRDDSGAPLKGPSLITLNDGNGRSFEEIAAILERDEEGYFNAIQK